MREWSQPRWRDSAGGLDHKREEGEEMRRKVSVGVIFILGLASFAFADFPERAIEIVVPFGAGGGSDTAARALVEGLKPHLKHGVVVTNMPGGGATKGFSMWLSSQQTVTRSSL